MPHYLIHLYSTYYGINDMRINFTNLCDNNGNKHYITSGRIVQHFIRDGMYTIGYLRQPALPLYVIHLGGLLNNAT